MFIILFLSKKFTVRIVDGFSRFLKEQSDEIKYFVVQWAFFLQ